MSGEILDLGSLCVHNIGCFSKMFIDQFLIREIDQGTEVDDTGRYEGQTPERDELDKEVGDKGRNESLSRD